MKLHRVHIENYRCLRDVEVELDDTTILIGENNSGKTAFMRAIASILERGRWLSHAFDEYDFFSARLTDDPRQSPPIQIDMIFRERFRDEWLEQGDLVEFLGDLIQFEPDLEHDQLRYVHLRLTHHYDHAAQQYNTNSVFVKSDGSEFDPGITQRNRMLRQAPFHYLDALRSPAQEMGGRSQFWRPLLESAQMDEQVRQEVIEQLSEVNRRVIEGHARLSEIVGVLDEMHKVIRLGAGPDNVTLQSLPVKPWEILKNLNIVVKAEGSDQSFPLSRHGVGTQSLAVLFIFKAYIDLLREQSGEYAEPILGLEEPEAHLHPHAQQAVLTQIKEMAGQKIISSHSPDVLKVADLETIRVFRKNGSGTKICSIPRPSRHRRQDGTLHVQPYLYPDEKLKVERFAQMRNAGLYFARLLLLFEGDSEEAVISVFAQAIGIPLHRQGVSLIPCGGQTYNPFLKIAHPDAFDIPWIIFADGDAGKQAAQSQVKNANYDQSRIDDCIVALPDGQDLEEFFIQQGFLDDYKQVILTEDERGFRHYCDQPDNRSRTEEENLRCFIDRDKPRWNRVLAERITENGTNPDRIPDLFRRLFAKVLCVTR